MPATYNEQNQKSILINLIFFQTSLDIIGIIGYFYVNKKFLESVRISYFKKKVISIDKIFL